ncbi:MAG: glycosyltransferase [Bacteroidia bacterium]|nr:glycosyltransferase [Bacteroidia bacterium]MDW8134392.1 glycosyltransferase [Bacteroidia bacterium]
MKAAYFTYDGLLDPLGQSQILPYLYGLNDTLGISFSVLSFEKQERWKHAGATLREELRRKGIEWIPLSFTRTPPILAKVYDNYRFHIAARYHLSPNQFSIFHARSYVAGWVAHLLSRRWKIPWIFDMRGFWADERKEMNKWNTKNPFYYWLYSLWKKREKIMLEAATAIVVLTEAAHKILLDWGVPAEKITIIPCVADYDLFKPEPQNLSSINSILDIPSEAYALGYVGSIGPLYELREMLTLFRVLLRKRPDSYMIFYTPAKPTEIYPIAHQLGIPVERLRMRFISRPELPIWLKRLDASIIFYRPGFSRHGTFPTRIAELLAMNIPVIAQVDVGDNRTLAQKVKGLYICERFSEEEYARVIDLVLESKEALGDAPRRTSEPLLALPVGISKYAELYQKLLNHC